MTDRLTRLDERLTALVTEVCEKFCTVLAEYQEDFPGGKCSMTVHMLHLPLAHILMDRGPWELMPIRMYEGDFNDCYHWWLQVGETIVDPTHGQFFEDRSALRILNPGDTDYDLYVGEAVESV